MDSADILKLAQGIWNEDLRQRTQAFMQRVRTVRGELAVRGIAGGPLCSAVFGEAVKEERERAARAREVLEQTVATVSLRLTASELQSIYRDLTTNIYQDLKEAYRDTISTTGVDRDKVAGMLLPLGAEGVHTLNQQSNFLELFAGRQMQAPQSSVTVFGALQTGSHATANLVQYFSSGESAELAKLRDAIAVLREEIVAAHAERPSSLVPTIADLDSELAKSTPRKNVVGGLLSGLAAGVDLLGNAPAAWTTVKIIAAGAGIHLG